MPRANDLFEQLCEHGEAAIEDLILDRASEELYLDFKTSAGVGVNGRLHENDQKNLATAISGFGNSEGGVVIWGVECKGDPHAGDVPGKKKPVDNPQRFKSWLERSVSGRTVPPHSGVLHHAIGCASEPGKGFVISFIPKSALAPHQTVQVQQYYMRAGSSFVPVPHGVLAGMFGKYPAPELDHSWIFVPKKVEVAGSLAQGRVMTRFEVGFCISNRGAVIARDVHATFRIPMTDGQGAIDVRVDPRNWNQFQSSHMMYTVVSKNGLIVTPTATFELANLRFDFEYPMRSPFGFDVTFGCDGSPLGYFHALVSADTQNAALQRLLNSPQDAMDGVRYIHSVLGLPTSWLPAD